MPLSDRAHADAVELRESDGVELLKLLGGDDEHGAWELRIVDESKI
jgi:hypothetical protein